MDLEQELFARSGSKCELCGSDIDLGIYSIPESPVDNLAASLMICGNCLEQYEDADKVEVNHWRCLNDSMWSEVPAVKVISWRMLNRLKAEGWPQDLLDMMYMEEGVLTWAKTGLPEEPTEFDVIHKDCNGVILQSGDTVVLTKDLDVKGADFAAKRGTSVRGISLVRDNAEQIEGRVNGQGIIILTKYIKKTN
jgi:protein PhnA